MSHQPSFPAPPPSPPMGSASPSLQTAPAQSVRLIERPRHRMSILSLLSDNPPPTPPDSNTTSAADHYEAKAAAKAPQVPPPDYTTPPVNDSAVAANHAEISTAAERLSSLNVRREANEHHQFATTPVFDNSLGEALINSPSAPVSHKGKRKDPELYDTDPTVHGNNQRRHEDRSANDGAAETLLNLNPVAPAIQMASILQDLRTKYVLTSPAVEHEPDHLLSSESEDEGPLPFTNATQISFTILCHGNHVKRRATQGNAVFDLARLRGQRYGLKDPRRETSCYLCKMVQVDRQEARQEAYEAGYRKLGCERFEREDTVMRDGGDDDAAAAAAAAAVDRPTDEERRAAAEEEDNDDDAYLAQLPNLRRKTIQRLEAEERPWTPVPEPPQMPPTTTTTTTTPPPWHTHYPLSVAAAAAIAVAAREAAIIEPVWLPLYAPESNVRDTTSSSLEEPTTAEQQPPRTTESYPALRIIRPLPTFKPLTTFENPNQHQPQFLRTPPRTRNRPSRFPRRTANRPQRPRHITATATAKMMRPSPLKQVQSVSSESESVQQSQHEDNHVRVTRSAGRAAAPSAQGRVSKKAGKMTLGRKESYRLGERGGERVGEYMNESPALRYMNDSKVKLARERGQSVPTSSFMIPPSSFRRDLLPYRPKTAVTLQPQPQPMIPLPPPPPPPPLPQQHPPPPPPPTGPAGSTRKRKADATATQEREDQRVGKEEPEPEVSWLKSKFRRSIFNGNNEAGPATATRKRKAAAWAAQEEQRRREDESNRRRKAEMEGRIFRGSSSDRTWTAVERARIGHMLALMETLIGDVEMGEEVDEMEVDEVDEMEVDEEEDDDWEYGDILKQMIRKERKRRR